MNRDNAIDADVSRYLSDVARVLDQLPVDAVERAILRLDEARWRGQSVYTCGNGGSAATAIHFACDLAKGAMAEGKPAFRTLSLCENISLVTAWSNDTSYEDAFAQRLAPWVRSGDVLLAISGSGNSQNVLNAVTEAARAGATTIGLSGFDGGKLRHTVDIPVVVPCDSMEQVEDVHLLLCHVFTACLRSLPSEANAMAVPTRIGQAMWEQVTARTPILDAAQVVAIDGKGDLRDGESSDGNGHRHG